MIGYSVGEGTAHIYKNSKGRIYVCSYVDGTLTDASGTVTCTVTDENDTTILNGVTATNDGTGKYYVDLGISNVTREAQSMDDAVHNAAPRSVGEPLPKPAIHPDDLCIMLNWLMEQQLDDIGQTLISEAQELLQS